MRRGRANTHRGRPRDRQPEVVAVRGPCLPRQNAPCPSPPATRALTRHPLPRTRGSASVCLVEALQLEAHAWAPPPLRVPVPPPPRAPRSEVHMRMLYVRASAHASVHIRATRSSPCARRRTQAMHRHTQAMHTPCIRHAHTMRTPSCTRAAYARRVSGVEGRAQRGRAERGPRLLRTRGGVARRLRAAHVRGRARGRARDRGRGRGRGRGRARAYARSS